jgi:pimeloyl-ACP methyl ester carboxylesterase
MYTTSIAVADLEALRIALGYEQFNLYGVSYGTRVALHYLRRYPTSTRSLVLDGVVPPGLSLGPNIALNAQAALDSIFARCNAQATCATAFPDLASEFSELKQQLEQDPPSLQLPHPVTGEPNNLTLDYGYLAMVVRLLSYAPETSALIPLTVHQAALGNFRGLAGQATSMLEQLSASLSYGMHNAVVCSEDAPHYPVLDTTLDAVALANTYIGAAQYDALKALCQIWPSGPTDIDFKDPVVSGVPVLVLSGEFDPITPPRYGEQVLQHLSNAQHLVAPGQGHGVVARGCIPRLVKEFVHTADSTEPKTLAQECIKDLAAMPFFVNSMGPVPAAANSHD